MFCVCLIAVKKMIYVLPVSMITNKIGREINLLGKLLRFFLNKKSNV